MNIFVVSDSVSECASSYCDIHVNKMLTETVQLLSVAHFVLDGEIVGMKPTHRNHPCAIWVRENTENYSWAFSLADALSSEYTFRTGKIHKSSLYLDELRDFPKNIPSGKMTDFAVAMPDEFKKELFHSDVFTAYRKLLVHKYQTWTTRTDKKQMTVKWSNRVKPAWAIY